MNTKERFEKLTPNNYDLGLSYKEEVEWLKNNEHLFTGNMYDEPAFTLDKEKVLDFIQKEISIAEQTKVREMLENLTYYHNDNGVKELEDFTDYIKVDDIKHLAKENYKITLE